MFIEIYAVDNRINHSKKETKAVIGLCITINNSLKK